MSTERTRLFILGQIAAASFVVLFQELTLIRWLPSQVRVTAYFPNLVLIAAFLGLGAGCLRARNRSLLALWPVSLLALTVVAASMRNIAFTEEAATEHLWLLYYDLPKGAPAVSSIRFPILLLFVLTVVSFIPLGQFVAQRLIDARRVATSLWGYASDLLGSFFGVVAFSTVSFARTRPIFWFAVVFVVSLVLYSRLRQFVVHALCAALALFLVVRADRAQLYSPYYALSIVPFAPAFSVTTNGSLHQVAAPLRRGDPVTTNDYVNGMRTGYHLPYRLLRRLPGRVLVLGAGTGNDVAVALDEGAAHVDVVEIDPVILEIGRQHPDHPYADPRVRVFNTDARAFLNHTKEPYDLVVFGTLDSMTRLSALSSVRLDNYVYTADCMRAVRSHLAPDGGVVLYFAIKPRYVESHIAAAITQGLGTPPSILRNRFPTFNTIFFAGPAFANLNRSQAPTSEQIAKFLRNTDIPTDDWPYLYLQSRSISPFYLTVIAAILAIAAISVFAASPQMRGGGFDGVMFLFGLAFLLIETRLVTEMNLVWGATWLTSAVVFGSILATITLATVLMELRPVSWPVASTALIASLLVTWLIPARTLVGLSPLPRLAGSALFVGAPVFFASCCFALLFASREQPDAAFGWNMFGAVCGGLLEFSSMVIGIKAATLLAAVAYLLAFLLQQRRAPATRLESA